MFLFKNKGDKLNQKGDSFLAHLSNNIDSKDKLFYSLNEAFYFPYFGHNWDALEDVLRDLSWIQEKEIILVHNDLPLTNSTRDLKIYLSILKNVMAHWLKKNTKIFKIYFPNDVKKMIEENS